MAETTNVDDLNYVNAFLEMIGGAQISKDQYKSPGAEIKKLSPSAADFHPDHEVEDMIHNKATEDLNLKTSSIGQSSQCVENNLSATGKIEQDSELNLTDSKFAPKANQISTNPAPMNSKPLTSKNINTSTVRQPQNIPKLTPTQLRLIERKELMDMTKSYQDSVLQKFRDEHASPQDIIQASEGPSKVDAACDLNNTVKVEDTVSDRGNEEVKSQSSEVVPFPDVEDSDPSVNIIVDDSAVTSPDFNQKSDIEECTKEFGCRMDLQGVNEDAAEIGYMASKDQEQIEHDALVEAKAKLQKKVAGLDLPVPPTIKATPPRNLGKEEDREHLTHFQTWGSPQPRNKPKSRVRKIILFNLPASADDTLVQSLVHGGKIDSFKLYGPTEKISTSSAHVIFTNADATDKYYDKYPNGLQFTFQGKKYTALVDKGKEVDVVSSVLESYLECGASRVVRATGADEDWGMRALQKLAEGKSRKVENIVDTYRNEIRTIVFRFTNISDAVHFKAQLVRDFEWEHCNIQFMDDPCEKATGIHLE